MRLKKKLLSWLMVMLFTFINSIVNIGTVVAQDRYSTQALQGQNSTSTTTAEQINGTIIETETSVQSTIVSSSVNKDMKEYLENKESTTQELKAQEGAQVSEDEINQKLNTEEHSQVLEVSETKAQKQEAQYIEHIIAYNTRYEADTSLPKGESRIKQQGINGSYRVHSNGIEEVINKPVTHIISVGVQPAPYLVEVPCKELPEKEGYIIQLGLNGINSVTDYYEVDSNTGELILSNQRVVVITEPIADKYVEDGIYAKER